MDSFRKDTADLISVRQIGWLATSVVASTGITFMPSIIIEVAGKSAWISILLAGLGGLLLTGVILYTNCFFVQKTIFEYASILLGKFLGSVMSLIYLANLYFLLMIITYEGARVAESNFIYVHRSPLILSILGYILCIYMVNGGIGVVTRINDFFLIPVLCLFLTLLILNIPFMKLDYALPLAPENWKHVGVAIPLPMLFFVEISLISVFLAYSRQSDLKNKSRLTVFIPIGIITVLMSVLSFIFVSTFGEKRASILDLPLFTLVKEIFYGNYLSNFQILLLPAVLIFVVVKISLFLLVLEKGIRSIGWPGSYEWILPILISVSIISATFSTIHNQQEMVNLLTIAVKVCTPMLVGIHLFLWIVLLCRKRTLKS